MAGKNKTWMIIGVVFAIVLIAAAIVYAVRKSKNDKGKKLTEPPASKPVHLPELTNSNTNATPTPPTPLNKKTV